MRITDTDRQIDMYGIPFATTHSRSLISMAPHSFVCRYFCSPALLYLVFLFNRISYSSIGLVRWRWYRINRKFNTYFAFLQLNVSTKHAFIAVVYIRGFGWKCGICDSLLCCEFKKNIEQIHVFSKKSNISQLWLVHWNSTH